MITPYEARQWMDYPQFTKLQKKIVQLRAGVKDDDEICDKLHITRSALEWEEEKILEEMDVPF